MATLKMGSTTVLTDTTLDNAVQDNITRLGTVTSGQSQFKDVVKVASGAFSVASVINIEGCFTSDYKFYKLFMSGGNGNTGYLELGFLDSSNSFINSTYYTRARQEYSASTSGIGSWSAASSAASFNQNTIEGFRINNTWYGDNTDEEGLTEVFFYDPNATGKYQHVQWKSSIRAANYVILTNGHGVQANNSTAKHGLRLNRSHSANFTATGHWAIYGYKI